MEIIFVVVLVIALALFFDFTNGFHDTANAMADCLAMNKTIDDIELVDITKI